jgi:hypothetical protein
MEEIKPGAPHLIHSPFDQMGRFSKTSEGNHFIRLVTPFSSSNHVSKELLFKILINLVSSTTTYFHSWKRALEIIPKISSSCFDHM